MLIFEFIKSMGRYYFIMRRVAFITFTKIAMKQIKLEKEGDEDEK